MRALTRSLLDLAVCDAATSLPPRIECDLAELTREALAAPQFNASEARLEEHLETVLVWVDPLGISRVLLSLLENALRHNKPGVLVQVDLKNEGRNALRTVTDNGRGIPPEALPFVFDRFYGADLARTSDRGSAGLGLAIARQIVSIHEGKLTAEIFPDGGVCFTIRLPML